MHGFIGLFYKLAYKSSATNIHTHTRRIYDKNLTIGRDIYMCVGQVHVGLSFAGGLRGADDDDHINLRKWGAQTCMLNNCVVACMHTMLSPFSNGQRLHACLPVFVEEALTRAGRACYCLLAAFFFVSIVMHACYIRT
jgi:hypothetical protein